MESETNPPMKISDRIVLLLEKSEAQPLTVAQIAKSIQTTKATANVQLSILKLKGMVNNPEKGLWVFRQ
jgi:hypothetical protein